MIKKQNLVMISKANSITHGNGHEKQGENLFKYIFEKRHRLVLRCTTIPFVTKREETCNYFSISQPLTNTKIDH